MPYTADRFVCLECRQSLPISVRGLTFSDGSWCRKCTVKIDPRWKEYYDKQETFDGEAKE